MLIVQTGGPGDYTPDLREAEKALRILTDPDWPFEIRALYDGAPRVKSFLCEDVADALTVLPTVRDAKGVYFTINPVGQYAIEGGSVADKHILSRRWLFIDIDARRVRDVSATNAELEEVAKVESAIVRFLRGRGWRDPVRILSGNGYHLHYRVSLPNDKDSHRIVRGAVAALKRRFDSAGAAIDMSVHNAARIVRLPGMWSRKGRPTVDRPHRMTRILSVPADIGITEESPIRELASEYRRADKSMLLTATSRSVDAYCLAALDRECSGLARAMDGERNNRTNKAAFAIGRLLHYGTFRRDEVRRRLLAAAIATGLPDHEAARTIDSGLDAGSREPRYAPDDDRRRPTNPDDPGETTDDDDRIIILGSEVERRPIDWLWDGRIPLGLLTGFAGRTSVGKSFILCDVAARLSTGREFPDGKPSGGPASTLIISEDPADTVLVPRLHELGADLSRIAFLKWKIHGDFTLKSLDILEKARGQIDNLRLIVIDPPANFLGQVDQHKDAEVRSMLGPLSSWASAWKIAVALISHFNKNNTRDIDAIMKVMGSVAWMTAVRVAHAMAIDPDDPNSRLFLPMKSNVGVMPPGLRYRIVPAGTLAVVEWIGQSDVSADDAMNGNPSGDTKASDVARRWIIRVFSERMEWLATELHDRRELDGISNNSFYDGLRTFPRDERPAASKREMGRGTRTVWSVPIGWRHAVPESAVIEAAAIWLAELLSFGEQSVDRVIRQGADADFDEFAVRSAAERIGVRQNRHGDDFFWSRP